MRNVISHAATFWIRDPRLSVEKLKTIFASEHAAGRSISFWRRPKLTVVRVTLQELIDDALIEKGESLAEELGCEVHLLYGETGSSSFSAAYAFEADGDFSWQQESPERPTAESRRIAKLLKLELLTDAQAERLDEDDALDDAERLRDLPYWKLHLELGLPGKRPLVDLSNKPALEPLGSGWTELERWATADERKASEASGAAAAKIDEALAKLAQRARGQRVTVFTANESSVAVCTEKLEATVVKEFAPRSIVLRKSKLARQTGARLHPQALIREPVKVSREELAAGLTLALVQKHFGAKIEIVSPFNWPFAKGAFESDESDPATNAWNALTELSNADVLKALAESKEPGMEHLFAGQLRDQIKEYIKSDPPLFAPFLAEALLAAPQNREFDTLNWLLLEPSMKKHAKNTRYIKTLKQLWTKTKTPRYLDALAKVGFPRPKFSPSRELLNEADYR
jgi:hypothetical protein